MNWHDDLALTWYFIVVGSTLGEPNLNILFAIFGFGMKVKG